MRFEGTLASWNDERGFGFLQSSQGGDGIFVHATAFGSRSRPAVGQSFSFEVEPGPRGRKRAKNVLPVRRPAPVRQGRRRATMPARWSAASALAVPCFVAIYMVVSWLWNPPLLVAGFYVLASIAAFTLYAVDKSAATRGEWRTAESTLHLVALAGGWPGALLAQQLFRHKSSKKAFRVAFWATVVLNVAAFVVLCSPPGRAWLATAAG